MARIIVVTPNPAVDVTYRVDRQVLGETNRVLEVTRRAGGKGVNVARGLAALGRDPICVLPLGGATGYWIAEALRDEGLEASTTTIAGLTRTTVAVTDQHAHPTLLVEPGPTLSTAEWSALHANIERLIADADMLIVSGSLPAAADPAEVGRMVAAARAAGVPVLVDSSGDALVVAARAGADILKPNLQELLEATRTTSPETALSAAMELGAGLVVASRGADGIIARDHERDYSVAAVGGVDGNPTGAGDAATAGLAAALLEGLPIDEALRWSAALGAAAVLRPVAGDVDLDAFHLFLSRPDTTK
ncbi:hexose kinase [Glaciihabitans sp. UYNi722]|uniref:1-phosphofructokinase family hexose kinase n=1 Tax=Glaciihabitans sp. UYNi722 TaxID=3156344 RepID=UPI003395DDC9